VSVGGVGRGVVTVRGASSSSSSDRGSSERRCCVESKSSCHVVTTAADMEHGAGVRAWNTGRQCFRISLGPCKACQSKRTGVRGN
jgi:hypothetical protein